MTKLGEQFFPGGGCPAACVAVMDWILLPRLSDTYSTKEHFFFSHYGEQSLT